jgi:hypothetical protein
MYRGKSMLAGWLLLDSPGSLQQPCLYRRPEKKAEGKMKEITFQLDGKAANYTDAKLKSLLAYFKAIHHFDITDIAGHIEIKHHGVVVATLTIEETKKELIP